MKRCSARMMTYGMTLAVQTVLYWPAVARGVQPDYPLDLSRYRPDCGVDVHREDSELVLEWPMADNELGWLGLELLPGRPLIRSMAISVPGASRRTLLESVDPFWSLAVGTRVLPSGSPPGMSVFNVFFDTPANRPYQRYAATPDRTRIEVTSHGKRATVAIGELVMGPFAGEMRITIYPGSRLVHMEAVVHTHEDDRAILYDAGLMLPEASGVRFAWVDTEGKLERAPPAPQTPDRHLAVRHRTLIVETDAGSVACFPPPHQFFFPRDLTENLRTVWYGRGHGQSADARLGFGIRQPERGGGSFVPWFNAPPGTHQRLGVFYLLSSGSAEHSLAEALRYAHGDRFARLAGYRTFTSHWHMAAAMAALDEIARGVPRSTPDFVGMFKAMGVDMVHLAEFHGDGHPRDSGPTRLVEMQAMFEECRRLSDHELLVIPGEEANTFLGLSQPGRNPGHWMYLFPRPVYWTMNHAAGQPFVEDVAPDGAVYHVGDRADMMRLLEKEGGLAWTSHPRIKASSWTPDIFRHEDFYLSDHWLGAAWKAMPADLSHERLGRRALDLLDDMANWGQKKYLLGEVDVFKLDHTHELYGHMNINYVRLEPDRLPRYADGWKSVVDALRAGRFFVTTGEVVIGGFSVSGCGSGEEVAVKPGQRLELRVELSWTFPLRFVELISGDGSRVHRERIDCSDTVPFGTRVLRLTPELAGKKWVRVEAWDVATNGAFTQPVWLARSR
jgi:hypothetical protein